MNNNNMRGNNGNNNNRRRGRTNNNRPQGGNGGGGQQVNRVDSRARGNAPQMLEKYRKLAHDAHLNGDRVTSEYYLQFADHYFRVIADTRTRQEEARVRRDDRFQDPADTYREEAEDANDLGDASDFPSFDQPPAYNRAPREHAPREYTPREYTPRPEVTAEAASEAQTLDTQTAEEQARNPYEPAENPFVRDNRAGRGLRPRREERSPRAGEARADQAPVAEAAPAGLDPMYLPPSISAKRRVEEVDTDEAAVKPVVKRRAPVRKPARKPDSDTGDLLDVVD